jgi:autotransporter-associated beta strand protein
MIAACVCAFAAQARVEAATCTWTGLGGNDNWSTGANWSTTPNPPAAGDDLVFSGSTRLTPSNDLAAGTTFNTLTIAAGSGNFVIGGNALTLTGGATALACNLATGTATLNLPLTFSTAAPTITSTAGGTLMVGGAIANGGLSVTVAAGGPTTLSGVISGAGGLIKSSAGTLILSAANAYTGTNRISAGTLQLSGSGTIGAATAVLDLNGGTLDLNNVATNIGVGGITRSVPGATASSIVNIANGRSLTSSGGVTFDGGTVTVTGSGSFIINAAANDVVVGDSTATTLDMTGLSAFSATVTNFKVGSGSAAVTTTASLALTTSTITATTISVGASTSSVAASGTLKLGTANTLAANTFVLGQKRSDGTIAFQAGLVTPTVTITDKTGGATASMTLGEYNSSPGGYSPAGTVNLTGGTVTAQLAALVCGKMNPNGVISSSANGSGTLTVDGAGSTMSITTVRLGQWASNKDDTATSLAAGTITIINGAVTIGTLVVGDKGSFGFAGNAFNKSTGTVNVQGGSLTVTTAFTFGDQTIFGTAASQVAALLNITGGTVTSNADITTSATASAPVKSTLTLNGGTLSMGGRKIGTAAATIGTGGGAVNWSSGTATAIGTINGTDGLTKATAGTLIMTGTNAYTGATTISAGTLQLGNGGTSGALPASSALTDNGALIFNRTDTLTQASDFPSVISGSGAVTQAGTGTVVLNGANTYTGTTTVQKGTLGFSSIANVGGGASALGAPTTVAAGTIALGSATNNVTLLYIGTGSTSDRVRDFAGTTAGVTIDQSGTGLLKFTSAPTVSGAGLKTLTLQGSTAGTGEIAAGIGDGASAIAVTKAGTGTWTLSGACTYTGATTISGGTLLVTGSTAASSAVMVASTATLGGTGTVSGTIAIDAGGSLAPGTGGTSIGTLTAGTTAFNATATYAVDLDGSGPSGDLLTTAGSVACAGTLSVGSANASAIGKVYTIVSAGLVSGAFTGLVNGAMFNAQGRTLQIAYTGTTVTLTDVARPTARVWDGGGGDDNWSTGANWDFDLAPSAGDALQFAGSTRTSPNNDYTAGTSFASIAFNAGASAFTVGGNAIVLASGVANSSANAQTVNLAMTMAATCTADTTGADLALGGALGGAGGLTVTGGNTLTLSGTNAWNGATTISAGTLKDGAAAVIPDSSAVTVASGATWNLNGFDETVGSLAGVGGVTLGGATLTCGGANTSTTYSGALSGNGALVKAGTGTLTLAGTNTATGTVTVGAGTLVVSGATAAGAAVTVASGGTLAGIGTVAGTVAVANGGTLAPGTSGTSIGTLTTGAVTCASSAALSVDLDGAAPTSDLVSTAAAVVCAGALTVASNANAALGKIYTIVSTSLASGVTGTFSGLADSAEFGQAGRLYRIAYSGTAVTLTDVAPVLTARQTLDTDGDGQIDRIRLTFDQAVNDSFAGLTVTVAGYTVAGYATGATANDAQIDVLLAESGSGDTGATPGVRITANTTLAYASGSGLVQTEGSATAATDAAAPVLLSAAWTDGGTGGVSAGDTVTLTFSESVAVASMTLSDLGLPVAADTLSTTTIADQIGATVTMAVAGSPRLTPGGAYSASTLTAGKPSGIFLASGAHITDAVGLHPAVGNAAVALDLGPGTTTVAIAWATGTDPKTWALGPLTVGTAGNTVTSGVDLTVLNGGNCNANLTIASAASSPSSWAPGASAGVNTYLMRADASGAASSAPANAASYGMTLSTSAQSLIGGLSTGQTTPLFLYFVAPTSVTSGGGVPQTVVVTITASLAP